MVHPLLSKRDLFSLKGQESYYHNLEVERYWLDLSTYICTISSKSSYFTDIKPRKLVKRSITPLLNSNSQAHVASQWLEICWLFEQLLSVHRHYKLSTLLLRSRVWVHRRLNIKLLWTYKSIVSFKVEILWLKMSHQDLNFHHCFLGGILVHVHVFNHTLLFKRQQL